MPQTNITAFTPAEYDRIQYTLNEKLDKDDISYRPSAAGSVAYLEGWRSFNLANQVFGFNGWSSEILQISQDFCDVDPAGKVAVGMSCMVRVSLRDGTFHDDIGYGSSEGQRSKGAAFEKAKKEAVTDAMKRALRVFGNRLGNCAYDKVFLRDVKNGTVPQASRINHPVPAVNHCVPAVTHTVPIVNQNTHPIAHQNVNQNRPNPTPINNQVPPPDYKPAWQPARSALLPSNPHTNPHTHQLHSDDFDALITEADLYDLEMS